MYEVLKDLWSGRVYPCEKRLIVDPNAKKIWHQYTECMEKLEEMVTKEGRGLLQKQHELCMDIINDAETIAFIKGFRLGAQMMIEALSANDACV